MRERNVAAHLKTEWSKIGGEHRKLAWENRAHAPDLLLLHRKLCTNVLVETKRPGKDARAGQAREIARLRESGLDVRVVNTVEQADALVDEFRAKLHDRGLL